MDNFTPEEKCVVPISGGMDSTVLLHKAVQEYKIVYALSFFYNQRHKKELQCAINTTKKLNVAHKCIDISFFSEIANTSSLTNNNINVAKTKDVLGDPQTVNYVPFRNMMMLSISCAFAESLNVGNVYHGAAQIDSVAGFWDASPEFIEKINNVTILNRRNKINIIAPLIDKSKTEIIKLGYNLNVDFSNTWTCYEGKEKACGVCTACSGRIKGFIDLNEKDPIEYEVSIPWIS